MEELQMEEREVILSIYDCDPAFKELSPVTYQYKFGEDGDPRSFLLEIIWGKEYPNEVPAINMNTFYNKHINNSSKDRICKFVIDEANNLLGCAMTYSLFECVKEKYFELVIEETENQDTAGGSEENNSDEVVEEYKLEEAGKSQKKEKKNTMTKAQKRKQWNRVDCHGERPRGWNWMDVIHHLSQTGSKNLNS